MEGLGLGRELGQVEAGEGAVAVAEKDAGAGRLVGDIAALGGRQGVGGRRGRGVAGGVAQEGGDLSGGGFLVRAGRELRICACGAAFSPSDEPSGAGVQATK